jgi:pimeloyl-ACP methyl ester carboxylesterase
MPPFRQLMIAAFGARTSDLGAGANQRVPSRRLRDMRPFPARAFAIFVVVAAAACTVGAALLRDDPPAARAAERCANAPDFVCATLTVTLDRRGKVPGTLGLRYARQEGDAPRGVLVFLSGGPGQPGVPFAPRVASRLAQALSGYRLVMIDQRGTGGGALQCPALQHEMGSTDLAVPSRRAVIACARSIGSKRRFFSTLDTVDDLEALRRELAVDKLTLDGVSYGTYVAELYALRYPTHVARLVLDSVLPYPSSGLPLAVVNAHAAGRVLRAVCAASENCGTDPAADLAVVVRRRPVGPRLLNSLVTMSVVDPSFPGVATALHSARRGSWDALNLLLARWGVDSDTPAEALSQGLHASTLCADTPMPWGGPAVPAARRLPALRRAAARVPARLVWPFRRDVASGNGIVKTCLWWPPVAAPPRLGRLRLPAVPVLLLAGDRDLSTPLPWAREEARRAPRGRLVIVRGAGHSTQLRASVSAARAALDAFLH